MTSFEQQIERCPKIRNHRLVELGIALGVLDDVASLIDLQPLKKESVELGAGTRVFDHALGLVAYLVAGDQLAGRSRIERTSSGSESQSPNESRDATS